MATIIVNRSPLGRGSTDYHEFNGRIIDWLQENYPHGFGVGIKVTLNGDELPLEELDAFVLESDVVEITVQPAGPAAPFLFKAFLSIAISFAVQKVFGPKPPKAPNYAAQPQASPIYSVGVAQNPVRIGEAIPVIYGKVMTTPDYGAQPYLAYTEVPLADAGATAGFHIEYLSDANTVIGSTNNTFAQAYLFINLTSTGWTAYPTGSATPGLVEGTVTAVPSLYGASQISLSPTNNALDPAAMRLDLIDPAGTLLYRITNNKSNVPISISRERGNNGDQYLCAMLCIGCGEFETPQPADIRVGDTTLDRLDPLTYSYACGGASLHTELIGPISFVMALASPVPPQVPTFWENVVTALEVGDQELLAFLDNTLYFPVGNKEVSRILVDIAFPRGLYKIDKTTGNFVGISVQFQIQVQIRLNNAWSDSFNRTVTVGNNSVADVSPWRRSLSIQCSPGVYRVRLVRTSAAASTDGTVSDALQWIGLRGFIAITPNTGQYAYGDCTMMALRLRANNLISENATSRIQVNVKRINPITGVFDANPAACYLDVATNQDYGARRPLTEIDADRVDALYTRWSSGSLGFNGAFTDQVTVYEALKSVLVPGVAEPMLVDGLMSIRYEGLQNGRTQIFTDANILQDSLSVSYSLQRVGEFDGVQVEYREPSAWKPAFYIYPETALNPQRINLFGVADVFSAILYARFLWQRMLYIRKRIKFDVELEGNIPLPGAQIGVQYSMVSISAGGTVTAYNTVSRLMTISHPFDFVVGTNYSVILRDIYGVPQAAIAVTPQNKTSFILATAPTIPIEDPLGNAPTMYAIGTTGQVASDWLVDTIAASGDNVFTIDASMYDTRIYDNSFSFLKVLL